MQTNGPKKQADAVILISNKIDFTQNLIKSYGKGCFILFKGKIHLNNILVLNIYTPNTRHPYFKKKLSKLKSHIEPQKLVSYSHRETDHQDTDYREILELTDILNQRNLDDTYRTFPPKTKENTIFSATAGKLSQIDYILGHKTNLN